MSDRAEALGWRMGWHDAGRYATGTRADRREVRRRLAKSEVSNAPFWTAYRSVLTQRAEDFGRAIAEGRVARTCRPTRLFALANREYAVS